MVLLVFIFQNKFQVSSPPHHPPLHHLPLPTTHSPLPTTRPSLPTTPSPPHSFSAPKIKHLVQHMTFSDQEVISLASKVDHAHYESSIQEVACEWLKLGEWKEWVDRVDSKDFISISLFVPKEMSLQLDGGELAVVWWGFWLV